MVYYTCVGCTSCVDIEEHSRWIRRLVSASFLRAETATGTTTRGILTSNLLVRATAEEALGRRYSRGRKGRREIQRCSGSVPSVVLGEISVTCPGTAEKPREMDAADARRLGGAVPSSATSSWIADTRFLKEGRPRHSRTSVTCWGGSKSLLPQLKGGLSAERAAKLL